MAIARHCIKSFIFCMLILGPKSKNVNIFVPIDFETKSLKFQFFSKYEHCSFWIYWLLEQKKFSFFYFSAYQKKSKGGVHFRIFHITILPYCFYRMLNIVNRFLIFCRCLQRLCEQLFNLKFLEQLEGSKTTKNQKFN